MDLIAITTIIHDKKTIKPGGTLTVADETQARSLIAGGFAREGEAKAETAAEKKAREKAEKEAADAAAKAAAEGEAKAKAAAEAAAKAAAGNGV